MTEHKPEQHQPLAGVRVVEIGTSVAAPFATWILAALGAQVVKVERPEGGDDARQWGALFEDGRGSYFEALNRDKFGITVDLRNDEDRAWLINYCATEADVVLQNLRAGNLESMGLGAVDLVAANPKLIYCNLRAFGATGPLTDKPGYDPLMQAFGGLMSVTGEEGRPAVRVGTSLIDMGTGMWCVIGILSALYTRASTGAGCVLDASLYETALAWMNMHTASAQAERPKPQTWRFWYGRYRALSSLSMFGRGTGCSCSKRSIVRPPYRRRLIIRSGQMKTALRPTSLVSLI